MEKYILLIALVLIGTSAKNIHKLQERIVGGSDAPDGAYPYTVSLHRYGRHSCGAAIISSEWVATTAACVYGLPERYMTIAAGSNSLSTAKIYQVLKSIVHENYTTAEANLALLKVETIDSNAASIVVDTEELNVETEVMFSGWGALYPSEEVPDKLQHAILKTISLKECREAYNEEVITKETICTSTRDGIGSCYGDNGGPLVRNIDNEPRLVGLMSWGIACAGGDPDVYTRMSSYVDWIKEKCSCI